MWNLSCSSHFHAPNLQPRHLLLMSGLSSSYFILNDHNFMPCQRWRIEKTTSQSEKWCFSTENTIQHEAVSGSKHPATGHKHPGQKNQDVHTGLLRKHQRSGSSLSRMCRPHSQSEVMRQGCLRAGQSPPLEPSFKKSQLGTCLKVVNSQSLYNWPYSDF
jgi:hypothetical protein